MRSYQMYGLGLRSESVWGHRRKKMLGYAVLLAIVAGLLGVAMFAGCGAQKPVTVGTVNKDITLGIAEASTVATTAEAEYQQGVIPQTAATRKAINDLGAAYNVARASWIAVLNAESKARAATNAQLAACTPAAAPPAASGAPLPVAQPRPTCPAATASAQQAATTLTDVQAKLNTALATMGTQTTAVKAITK